MEETTFSATSSSSPCQSNDATAKDKDYAEDAVQWLDQKVSGSSVRVWHIAGIVFAVLLSIVVGLCCCVRFRVPRTKQEIEADYIRKKITKSFRSELSKISNNEMDEMDLQKALDRIRSDYEGDTSAIAKECAERSVQQGFRSRFNAVFGKTRVRFSPHEHAEASVII